MVGRECWFVRFHPLTFGITVLSVCRSPTMRSIWRRYEICWMVSRRWIIIIIIIIIIFYFVLIVYHNVGCSEICRMVSRRSIHYNN